MKKSAPVQRTVKQQEKVFTGEILEPVTGTAHPTVTTFVTGIRENWTKATNAILEVAELCAKANRELNKAEKKELLKQLPFSPAAFSKLVKIGDDERLKRTDVAVCLPPNYSIIYELTALSLEDLEIGIDRGIIRPSMSRTQALELRDPTKRGPLLESEVGREAHNTSFIGGLWAHATLADEAAAELEVEIGPICEKFGVVLIKPRDAGGLIGQIYIQSVDKKLKKLANERIKQVLKVRTGLKKFSWSAVQKKTGYTSDEVEIQPDFTWEDVRNALDAVGIGDEFEGLRDQAINSTSVPTRLIREAEAAAPEDRIDIQHLALGATFPPEAVKGFK